MHTPRFATVAMLLAATGAVLGARPFAWTCPSIATVSAVEPVFDDVELVRGFSRAVGGLADGRATLDSAAVGERLVAAAGRSVAAPVPPEPPIAVEPAGRTIYEAVVPAVVALGSVFKCSTCNDWHVGNMAAGWIASPDGLVVTNHHVLERAAGHHLGVMTSDGGVLAVTDVVAADAARDTAVIRVDPRGRQLPHLGLGVAPGCGSSVTIVSHPKGRFFSLTKGVVSRYHRMRYGEHANRPATDAAVPAPTWMTVTAEFAIGSSGGPVFDDGGRVVGMVSRTSPGGALSQGKPKEPSPGGEQMIFRECVPVESLRSLFAAIPAP